MEGICCVYSELQEKMQRPQERKLEESILPEVCNLDGSVCDLYIQVSWNKFLVRVSCTRNLDRLSGALR